MSKEKQLVELIEYVYDHTKDQYAREHIRKHLRLLGIWEKPEPKPLPISKRFDIFLADFKAKLKK